MTPPKLMTPSEMLRMGRNLLSDKARWTRHYFARNAAGRSVPTSDPQAVCWCALGALRHFAPGQTDIANKATNYLRSASRIRFGETPSKVNDTCPHTSVMQMYSDAIELAELSGD